VNGRRRKYLLVFASILYSRSFSELTNIYVPSREMTIRRIGGDAIMGVVEEDEEEEDEEVEEEDDDEDEEDEEEVDEDDEEEEEVEEEDEDEGAGTEASELTRKETRTESRVSGDELEHSKTVSKPLKQKWVRKNGGAIESEQTGWSLHRWPGHIYQTCDRHTNNKQQINQSNHSRDKDKPTLQRS
jgi:hypothetical protein